MVAFSSSDLSSLLMMSKTSGERIVPFFLIAISLTSPDEVVFLMMASVKSRFSSGSWAAYWIADDRRSKITSLLQSLSHMS